MIQNKKRISNLALTVYIIFMIVALFHNHPYYLGSQSIFTESHQGQDNSVKDPFLDSNSNCRIAQLSHSSYLNITASPSAFSFLPINKNLKVFQSEKCFENLTLNSNQLRAPPII